MKQVPVVSYRQMKDYPGHTVINTTSRSTDWGKEFSPFTLGPVDLYNDHWAENVENAWQFTKVYSEHVDFKGEIKLKEYMKWATKGWEDTYAHRYPMGKGRAPLYSWWDGEKLSYVEARKKIYAPIYSQAVIQTDAFKRLKEMYHNEEPFVLVDFDGYDYIREGKTLKEVMNDPHKKMGHAFVLAMLLQYPILEKRYGER